MNNSQISILPYLGKSPQFDHTVFIADGVRVIGDVTLGSDVSVWFNTVIRGDVNFVRIGDACNIQDNSCLHVENGICPLILGKGITVG
ncbi:MAG: gamma carbonic anhydrase family protein, partial [Candidatus Cloacimonetes bacterium]|nr:gamma carbonic anhydrase family protein [Candidatus Cloacimonadota bacterium]